MNVPEPRYADADGVKIAYRVIGAGDLDLVFCPGWINHLDLYWDAPQARRFFEQLASFARVILYDKRGAGLSDRTTDPAWGEQRVDDVRAVMDDAGSERAALMGLSEGGSTAIRFAATDPQRTAALVLCNTGARWLPDDDYPCPEGHAEFVAELERTLLDNWGRGHHASYMVPSLAHDPRVSEFIGRYERLSMSPAEGLAVMHVNMSTDVRSVLPTITAPTLVVHRTEDRMVPVEHARYLAAHIEGARYAEFTGADHVPWIGDNSHEIADEIQEFLTGVRPERKLPVDRVLRTVLFTDIVGSTERAAAIGDARWKDLLDAHDGAIRGLLRDFRGEEIHTTGDGFLVGFDGPARAIHCAQAIAEEAHGLGLEVRAGLHTGECSLRGDDLAGIAVHIGARVASLAGPGEVLVTSTVRDLVAGSGIEFADRGRQELKGVPGEWQVLAVEA